LPGGNVLAITNVRGFKYTHAFNRNPQFHGLTDELSEYRLLSLSTHCQLVTKDNKVLFGTKRNQFNQISNFSGFPNVDEDSTHAEGRRYLDIYRTMKNRLAQEIGGLVKMYDRIQAVGITYVNTPGLRGLDSDYLVPLSETADNARKHFEESFQFEKELYVVDFEPKKNH
jgi:hypothetical protein